MSKNVISSFTAPQINATNVKKVGNLGNRQKRPFQYKSPILQNLNLDDSIDSIEFEKCKLSLRSPTTPNRDLTVENNKENVDKNDNVNTEVSKENNIETNNKTSEMDKENTYKSFKETDSPDLDRKNSTNEAPDIVRGVANYSEDELENHKAKLQELQLRQRLMEEQNKKRKEMLSKALADRYVIQWIHYICLRQNILPSTFTFRQYPFFVLARSSDLPGALFSHSTIARFLWVQNRR